MAIYVINVRDMCNIDVDMKYAIMRSYRNPQKDVYHLPALSPDSMLLRKYLSLRNSGEWCTRAFVTEYVPDFLEYIIKASEAKRALNRLYEMDKAGMSVAIGCSCYKEILCHRSIVAGLLQGVHCNVITSEGLDYTHFYKKWLDMKGGTL